MSQFAMSNNRQTPPAPLTVAAIMDRMPRVTLPADESVELGRQAYAALAAGTDLVEIEIGLFATREMVAAGILDYLAAQSRAGRLTTLPAVA